MKTNNRLLLASLFVLPFITWAFLPGNPSKNQASKPVANSQLEDTTNVNTIPAVLVKDDNGVSHPIRMTDLNVAVEIVGNIATTTMSMTFHNDSSRVLEGELYFPLGEGQTVSRFAMDVNGTLREGVVVEKNKGQQVFESVIRRKIDPGLLEWTNGNNFKARVYPLEADGDKHIVIAYEQELNRTANAYTYQLPMSHEQAFDQFTFKLKAHRQQLKPTTNDHLKSNFTFRKDELGAYSTKWEKKNYTADENITIELPIKENEQQILTEKIPGTNSYYYYLGFPEKEVESTAFQPNSIALIWDASTSSTNRNLDKEFQLLQQYLSWNKNAEIRLYELRNELLDRKEIRLTANNFDNLKKTLLAIPFDGASAYEQIDYSKLEGEAILLFGDGLLNFGERNLKLPEVPIFAINSSISANHSHLKYLTSSTGGGYINLTNSDTKQGLQKLKSKGYKYFGNGQSDSYPALPTIVEDQVHVAGIIRGKETITFELGTEVKRESIKVTIDPTEHLTDSGLLGRIWAQKKLTDLDVNYKENREEITELGKKFNIVTRSTSLIVLDRIEDYVEYEIVPPKELQQEFYAQLKKRKKSEKDLHEEHMAKVRKDFKSYVEWWNKDIDLERILEKDRRRKAEEKRRAEEAADRAQEESLRHESENNSIMYNDSISLTSESIQQVQVDGNSYSFSNLSIAAESDVVGALSVTPGVQANASFDANNSGRANPTANIGIEKWVPDAPYMNPLKNSSKDQLYAVYLQLKREYEKTPSFFLDAADVFLEKGLDQLGLRVLSNIAEFELENHELMRVLAHRLEQLEKYDLAIALYQKVLKLRKEEPQSYRDLGLCLAKKGEYQNAITILYKMVGQPWDQRFPGIETIALVEMNQIIAAHRSELTVDHIDSKLLADLPTDVRVVLNWDADNCDMDLWVTDPRGEKCFYSHKKTEIGGLMSNDFTGGYGPEQFVLKNAMKGNYTVQVDYYGTNSQRVSGPTTIQVQMITNFGKPNEKVEEVTRRLGEAKEVLNIGTFSIL